MKNKNAHNLNEILKGCKKHDRKSQKTLYSHFFSYAMSICVRYTRNENFALEVVNDSFMKVYTNIEKFDNSKSFKSWFRRILINSSIDCLKKEFRYSNQEDIGEMEVPALNNTVEQNISHKELIRLIQKLSPAYRSVFNLFVIDGYSHDEISTMLGISTGTSKSNLAKARMKLRKMLMKIDSHEFSRITR